MTMLSLGSIGTSFQPFGTFGAVCAALQPLLWQ
jgi:hypothetical protein